MPDRRAALPLLALACTGPGPDTDPPAPPFDAAGDFSASANPSGRWSYGYTETPDLDPDALRLDAFAQSAGPMVFWHPSAGPDGYYPYVAANPTGATTTDATGGWALASDRLALEGANDGRYAVVAFEAPGAGVYDVRAAFEGVHFGLSTTDVHVLVGPIALFDAIIAGYGGDPAFHEVQGASPTASWQGVVALGEGDVVWFAVGFGANGTHYSDTTAVGARVERLTEP